MTGATPLFATLLGESGRCTALGRVRFAEITPTTGLPSVVVPRRERRTVLLCDCFVEVRAKGVNMRGISNRKGALVPSCRGLLSKEALLCAPGGVSCPKKHFCALLEVLPVQRSTFVRSWRCFLSKEALLCAPGGLSYSI